MSAIENAFAGIVVTAQTFNPSIFTESWLARNCSVPVENLIGVRLFSPELAQFQTANVQVLVVPPKMQITFKFMGTEDTDTPRRIASRTIEALPHTPYQALGLNFDFFVAQPKGQDFGAYDRALLGNGANKLIQEFTPSDARFGRYFSKNHGEARLRLDVKPVRAGPENREFLQFGFNFHHDVAQYAPEDRAGKLAQLIAGWGQLRQDAERMVTLGGTS